MFRAKLDATITIAGNEHLEERQIDDLPYRDRGLPTSCSKSRRIGNGFRSPDGQPPSVNDGSQPANGVSASVRRWRYNSSAGKDRRRHGVRRVVWSNGAPIRTRCRRSDRTAEQRYCDWGVIELLTRGFLRWTSLAAPERGRVMQTHPRHHTSTWIDPEARHHIADLERLALAFGPRCHKESSLLYRPATLETAGRFSYDMSQKNPFLARMLA